jgi:hypothetical protein
MELTQSMKSKYAGLGLNTLGWYVSLEGSRGRNGQCPAREGSVQPLAGMSKTNIATSVTNKSVPVLSAVESRQPQPHI